MATMVGASRSIAQRFKGVLFAQFKEGRKPKVQRHWMDTNTDKYYKALDDIVIPDCKSFAKDLPGYPERIEELIRYTMGYFNAAWSFPAELMYRMAAPESHQTEENIQKVYVLRVAIQMLMTSVAVLDDITDHCDMRIGKKTWHGVCEGGVDSAIYDCVVMGMLPLVILQKNLRDSPGYMRMTETLYMANMRSLIGQTMDHLGQKNAFKSMDYYLRTIDYKTGQLVAGPTILGLLHAGHLSEKLINQVLDITTKLSSLMAIWDDFNDYYCASEDTGKPSLDLVNGGSTWLCITALNHFSPAQAKEFKECYGSKDPKNHEKVRQLYDEIDLTQQYIKDVLKEYKSIREKINGVSEPKVSVGLDCRTTN